MLKYEVTTDMVEHYFAGNLKKLTQVFNGLFKENTRLKSEFIKNLNYDILERFLNADCNIHEPSGWHCEECCDCRTKGQLKEWDWHIGCRYDHE